MIRIVFSEPAAPLCIYIMESEVPLDIIFCHNIVKRHLIFMVVYYYNSHACSFAVMANEFKLRFLVVLKDAPRYVTITRCVEKCSLPK